MTKNDSVLHILTPSFSPLCAYDSLSLKQDCSLGWVMSSSLPLSHIRSSWNDLLVATVVVVFSYKDGGIQGRFISKVYFHTHKKNYWARSESISLKISEDHPCYPSLGHNSIVWSVFYKILILQSYVLQRIFLQKPCPPNILQQHTMHEKAQVDINISGLLSSQNAATIEHKHAPVKSMSTKWDSLWPFTNMMAGKHSGSSSE